MSASAVEHDRANLQEFSPAGLKVLVVDDDKLCLKVIGKMLQQCNYEVSTCCSSAEALALLRHDDSDFDLVLSDVVMPDMDGFKLLELIGLEMDVPVIMMSYDGDTNTVLKGVTHGAVDFLTKPVRQEELSNMWQHVVRRRRTKATSPSPEGTEKQTAGPSNSSGQEQAAPDDMGAGQACKLGKRGPDDRADSAGGNLGNAQQGGAAAAGGASGAGSKRPRVHWTSEMHSQFVSAVNQLGIDKAVPKKILELMTVKGLTRENVASHLQKYRLYLKKAAKMDGPQQQQQQPAAAPMPQQPQQQQPQQQQQQQQHMASGMMPAAQGVQADGQFSQTYMGQPAGMVMPGVQSMQPVFDQQGFAQAPWQQPMMVTGTPPVYHPQGAWQPMMGQPMMGQPHMEPSTSQAVAGVPFGVAAGVPRPTQQHNTNSMSTLPPLAGDRMDSSLSMSPLVDNLMIGDGNGNGVDVGGTRIKRSSADTLGFSGMSASYMDDSGLDGPIPEDMEEFLSILTKDAPQEA